MRLCMLHWYSQCRLHYHVMVYSGQKLVTSAQRKRNGWISFRINFPRASKPAKLKYAKTLYKNGKRSIVSKRVPYPVRCRNWSWAWVSELTSFPGSHTPEAIIEIIQAWRAWYFCLTLPRHNRNSTRAFRTEWPMFYSLFNQLCVWCSICMIYVCTASMFAFWSNGAWERGCVSPGVDMHQHW